MNLQKLILPGIILIVILLIYFAYFNTGSRLGSFSSFDTNNNANKDIVVQLVKDKKIEQSPEGFQFFVKDKDGKEVLVAAPADLPENFQDADKIILTGHLHPDHFHATEVKLE